MAYSIADSSAVGSLVGNNELAAVSAVSSFSGFILNIIAGIAVGASVIIARSFGAKDERGVERGVHTSVILSVIIGTILSLFVSSTRILSPIYSLISYLSHFLSDIDYVYVYTEFKATEILITVTSVLLILFLVLNIKNKIVPAVIFSIMLCSVYSTAYIMTRNAISNDTLLYYSDDGADTFICCSGARACVVDSKTYSISQAYKTVALIENMSLYKIDTYILPIYYQTEDEMLIPLLNTVKIDTIAVPIPKSESEQSIFDAIFKICTEYGVKLNLLENDTKTSVGNFSYIPIFRTPYGEQTQIHAYTMIFNDKFCTYVSSGFLDTKYEKQATKAFAGSDTLILGEQGKKYKDEYCFRYEIQNLKALVFNSDNTYINDYTNDFYISQETEIFKDIGFLHLLSEDQ